MPFRQFLIMKIPCLVLTDIRAKQVYINGSAAGNGAHRKESMPCSVGHIEQQWATTVVGFEPGVGKIPHRDGRARGVLQTLSS